MNIKEKYEIDLNNFEKVTLHNKHEYVKLINKVEDSIIMLDITKINMPLVDYMKLLQDNSLSYKTDNAIFNATGIIEGQKKSKTSLEFISVDKVNLDNVDDLEKRKIISMFIKNKDLFNPKIRYINTKEAIALDENYRVVEIFLNQFTNKYEPRYANTEVIKSEEKVATETFQGNFDGIDFEATLDYLEIDNKVFNLGSETITLEEIEKYDKDEASLNNSSISLYKKSFIIKLLEVYRKRKSINEKRLSNNPLKIKVLQNKNHGIINKAAFVNHNLIVFISGVNVGIAITLLIYFLMRLFLK